MIQPKGLTKAPQKLTTNEKITICPKCTTIRLPPQIPTKKLASSQLEDSLAFPAPSKTDSLDPILTEDSHQELSTEERLTEANLTTDHS